jgi:putative cell wall-binding protein
MLTLTGFAAVATPATAQSNFSLQRQAGADRYATAAQIATNAFTTADTVLIASGEAGHFADALTGNFLAGRTGSPVLLTTGDALPKATSDALATLRATKVTILGGTSAVSQSVQDALAANYTVTRIGGANRYATGQQVAAAGGTVGQTEGKGATAILASGLNFPDALVAGGLGYAGRLPVEITDPNTLSAETSASLTSLAIKNVVIVGGTSAVSQKVQDEVAAKGITVTRLAGTTRQGTAAAVANYATSAASGLGFSKALVNLATGADFPDALTGGPSAGKDKAPLLLTVNANTLGADTQSYLSANSSTLTGGKVFGGTSVVSDAAVAAAQTAGRGTVQASMTTRPELRSATITGTVTQPQASSSNPAGTTVNYVFDEAVASAAVANFKLYNASATAVATPTLVAINGSTVTVRYTTIDGTTDTNGTGGTAAANVNNYALAAVNDGAATDFQGQANPEGSVAVGTASSSTTTATANTTVAPDLRSVGGFRQANTATPNHTAVDFTFDQAAFTTAGASFKLVLTNGDELTADNLPPLGSSVAGGGTVPGGNGTTTVTVLFPNIGGTATTITAADVSRGYVGRNSVADTQANANAATPVNGNPLQSANVSNGGATSLPDLTSATFLPANTGANTTAFDQVLYTFDQAVTPGAPAGFHVFRANADQANGVALGTPAQNSAGTQVLVNFAAGDLTNAVGASVDAAATTTGKPASVGVAPVKTSSSNVTPGQVQAPQLTSVAINTITDQFGTKSYTASYTFDKAVGVIASTANTAFHLYTSSGTTLTSVTCGSPTGATSTNQVVTCTVFGGSASIPADTIASTLGTVDAGAVTGATAPNNNANPEGAAATTGGTGTPAA